MNQDAKGKHIVILGGGTAGWMAANYLAKHWLPKGFAITLIESPEIGIIGVGEGSTPPLKEFLQVIGVTEADWMAECNATYKVGISFKNWSTKPGYESYIHPFLCQPDDYTVPAFFHNSFLIRKGVDLEGHPDHFFLASHLSKKRLSPVVPENFPFEIKYGYHFDSGLLGKFLSKWAVAKGVKHKQAKVTGVLVTENGYLGAVKTDSEEVIEADLFVDCTGFRSQLLQQTLGVTFNSFADRLFNDSAVVFPTEQEADIECQTQATALKHGWAWKIPLTSRNGNGYVYSSAFCSADEAETELRSHLGLLDSDIEARHLKMKVGRVDHHWYKNCLAVGLSQGFIEPLEATALDLVQTTLARFVEFVEKGNFTDQYRDEYNAAVNTRFDAVRDYIHCHYRINSRTDTEYWRANANNENMSPSLRAILKTWVSGNNITDELERQKLDVYFPNVSWNCLLAGKGIYPDKHQLRAGNELAHRYKLTDIRRFIERCALNFQPHHQALAALRTAEPPMMRRLA